LDDNDPKAEKTYSPWDHLKMTLNQKILVIDDDLAVTELMSMLLKTFGFEVLTTNNGMEGIRLVKEFEPNVVLLDLMMPDVAG